MHSLPSRGSVGERFFDASPNISMLKRMKKRLSDTVDHFHKLASKQSESEEEEDEPQPNAEEEERRREANTHLAK